MRGTWRSENPSSSMTLSSMANGLDLWKSDGEPNTLGFLYTYWAFQFEFALQICIFDRFYHMICKVYPIKFDHERITPSSTSASSTPGLGTLEKRPLRSRAWRKWMRLRSFTQGWLSGSSWCWWCHRLLSRRPGMFLDPLIFEMGIKKLDEA
jgi:hypothetical protein